MAGLDGLIFERDFEIAVAMSIGGGICTWNSDGSHLAHALSQRSGGVRKILWSFLRKI